MLFMEFLIGEFETLLIEQLKCCSFFKFATQLSLVPRYFIRLKGERNTYTEVLKMLEDDH